MSFRPAPTFSHGQAARIGILWVNLGTPDAPTASAVRRYLAEFLSDCRVIELPRLLWAPILHGIILRTRPAKSARKYASIWTPEGSPLLHWTRVQAAALQERLRHQRLDVVVEPAMRYGQPSISDGLAKLQAQGATRILIMPAYPQYSGASTGSTFDAVARWGLEARWVPEFRFVHQYHDEPRYIQALANKVRQHWSQAGRGEMLLMSFHGMPERTLHEGDPYHCQCQKTARLLAEALDLTAEQWRITFQSRFGRSRWLEPATEPTAIALARAGLQRLDVVCPGFLADCLETLEEINGEVREAFLTAGGKVYQYIPCLNGDQPTTELLTELALRHLSGWPTHLSQGRADDAALADSRKRAFELGAPR
jgi:protoporphyrin/coproporphyrin ferrochelatase